MKIAVVDDERPARSELCHQLSILLPEAKIQEGDCGEAALMLAGQETFDLFFLDINLGDINGTSLVHALKNMQPRMKIIFVTAYSEYAVKAFELGVEDYVMKPYDQARLQKALAKCLQDDGVAREEKTVRAVYTKRMPINTNGRTLFMNVEDIVYVETDNRGCMIHGRTGDFYEGRPIGEYEKKLDPSRFYRIHKSYLVNLELVHEIFPWSNNSFALKMQGYEKSILPVARDRVKALKQLLGW